MMTALIVLFLPKWCYFGLPLGRKVLLGVKKGWMLGIYGRKRGKTCNGFRRSSTLKEIIWGMAEAPGCALLWLLLTNSSYLKLIIIYFWAPHFLAILLKLAVFQETKGMPLVDIQPKNCENLVSMVFTNRWYLLRYIVFPTIGIGPTLAAWAASFDEE